MTKLKTFLLNLIAVVFLTAFVMGLWLGLAYGLGLGFAAIGIVAMAIMMVGQCIISSVNDA